MAIVRIILGIVVGIAIGLGLVMAGDWINHQLWPPPPEVQVTNPESIREYMATAPITSLLGLPVTWTFAALAGAFAGAKIAERVWVGWISGGLLFAATCLNLAMIPHPLWMLITSAVLVPLAVWFGAKLGA
jgi:hypothetical protein